MNRLLLPDRLESDKELRQAASRLHADIVLIYTFDTAFYERNASTPLSLVSLGLSPTVKVRVVSTVSAIVLDSRTGYLYGALEATHKLQRSASHLTSTDVCDALRQKVERQAFDKFLDSFDKTWKGIVDGYSDTQAASHQPQARCSGHS